VAVARTFSALAIAAAATAFGPAVAGATYPGRNGEIVFHSSRPPASGWAMDPDGGNERLLMRDPADHAYGGFRADGRRYVFWSCRHDDCGLYVMHADGSHVRRVPGGPTAAVAPRFGPDGKRIVYELDGSIHLIGADGRHPRSLGPGRLPDFSPGGRWIAYDGEDGHIRLVHPDGSGRRRVMPGLKYELGPSFSPDGRRIAFLAEAADGWLQLFVMDVDGTHVRRLTGAHGGISSAVFSPDGRRIAFSRSRGGDPDTNWDVYVIDADGTHVRRLTRAPTVELPADWRPLPAPGWRRLAR
jgi:TolB protein